MSTQRHQRITDILTAALQPLVMEIRDESHLHAGHNSEAAAGGTHFRLTIGSDALAGLSRVAQHRRINELLAAEFDTGLHALTISVVEASSKAE